METNIDSRSNSAHSLSSLDKSDTNQSDESPDLEKGDENEKNFAKVSEMQGANVGMPQLEKSNVPLDPWIVNKDEDADNDLKELSSDLLSKQMSKVVTQLEKHAIDDFQKVDNESFIRNENSVQANNNTVIPIITKEENMIVDKATNIEQKVTYENLEEMEESICDPEQSSSSNLEDDKSMYVDSENITNDEPLILGSKPFSDIQIKVIDVPDDEDLFDFLKQPTELDTLGEPGNSIDGEDMESLEEMKQRELYRLLTESNPSMRQSNEATPYQSGDDKSDGESSDRSGATEEILSDSDEEQESSRPHLSHIEEVESRPETPVKPEEREEPQLRPRRKPGPKPRSEKPQKKPRLAPGQLTEKTLEKLEKCRLATDKWLKDLEVPESLSLEKALRFDIVDLNPYLTCGLCKGYLYEASTITECMHTFCKNCIVRHCMEVSLHCPVCNILIHPTDPFVHIRLDRMIQDIVYKIMPNVAATEMKNIKAFYKEHPEDLPKEIKEEPPELRTSPKDEEKSPRCQPRMVSLLLESENDAMETETLESLEKKFIRVNSSASVRHVCEYIKKKHNLDEERLIDLFCCGDAIDEEALTLEDIKSKFFGDEDCLMLLQYRVRDT